MTPEQKVERMRLLEVRVANAELALENAKHMVKAARDTFDAAVSDLRSEITRDDIDQTEITFIHGKERVTL